MKGDEASEESGDLRVLSEGRKKRVFVQLATAAAVLIAAILFAGAYLVVQRTDLVQRLLSVFLGVGAVGFLVIAGLTLGAVVLLILTGIHSGYWERTVRPLVVRVLLPLAVMIGRVVGIDRDDVQGSFLSVNNALIGGKGRVRLKPSDVLVLLPRCLQWADCPHKVSEDVHRCKRCGRCSIGEIVSETEKMGVPTFVSTGGTQARRLVKMLRPKVILAVACERELTEGIRDVGSIPVIAVVNERPEGPCYNTAVDPARVNMAIRELIEEGVDTPSVHV
ncbi:MAG: DUF116 domain-containing protein [Clostridia bacterium]